MIAAVVLGILILILVVVTLDDGSSPAPGAVPVNGNPAEHAISAPRGSLAASTFSLLSGAASVTVRTADIGGDLYRVSTPVDSGLLPKALDRDGRVELQLVNDGPPGATAVDVQLSAQVKWSIRMAGGATQEALELDTGKVAAVDLVVGATHIDVTLPKPTGTIPIRVTGGASDLAVHTPAGVPSRVSANNGAGSITLNGVARSGISAGTVLNTPGWESATDRYDVQLVSGVGVLTVDNR
ncbi:MAG TPA: hypothetical protein VMU51_25520 [Mycobacteriales bacterium]|nr:hypothetical protein [Mycobacteriales bacterium]